MIGVNPLSDQWSSLYTKMCNFGDRGFDGDWGEWDGKMLAPFQYALRDLLASRTEDPEIGKRLLSYIINTPTICKDMFYVSTHSTPSGHPLTGHFNSLINKMYTMYIYYKFCKERNIKASLSHFCMNVLDIVFGDDKMIVTKLEGFDGVTFEKHANSMGLKFTPADKSEWSDKNSLVPISRFQFLKRSFAFHNRLGQIVAPLEKRTIQATLNFISDSYRNEELTLTKLSNAQREFFLHEDYEENLDVLIEAAAKANLNFVPLPRSYLVELYRKGDYAEYLISQASTSDIRCRCSACLQNPYKLHDYIKQIIQTGDLQEVRSSEFSRNYITVKLRHYLSNVLKLSLDNKEVYTFSKWL
jgi:hypothetical protein